MKLLKRALCFVIAAFIALPLCSVSAADNTQKNVEVENAMEILRLLGLMEDYYDYNTNLDEEVSRADFVNMAGKLIKASSSSADGSYYYDVPPTHFAYASINALTEMGVVKGVKEKIFDPDAPIEEAAAYKILLSIIGYGQYAEYNGGYPAGYITVAGRLKIADKVSGAKNLTRGNMLKFIYRTAKTEMLVPVSIGSSGGSKYEVSDDKTILSVYYDIYYDKGIVNGAAMVSVDGSAPGGKKDVKINETIYTAEIDASHCLGLEAEFLYRRAASENEGEIIWIKPTGKTDSLFIDEEDVAGFDSESYTLSYYDARDVKRSVTLNRGITVIYNGKVVSERVYEVFNLPQRNIRLIEQDGEYTVAFVEVYDTYVVGRISTDGDTIYDKKNAQAPLNINEADYDCFSLYNAAGVNVSTGSIKTGTVLSVAFSQDKTHLKIIVSNNVAAGKLDVVEKRDNGTNITVDGKEYFIPSFAPVTVPKVGSSVKLYMDYKDRVIAVDTGTDSNFAAYIYKLSDKEGSFGEPDIQVKALKEDGTISVLSFADSVSIDGYKSKDAVNIKNALCPDGSFSPQIALISLNGDGEIRELDTVNMNFEAGETEENSLSVNIEKTDLRYRYNGSMEGKGMFNRDTIIFRIPTDEEIGSAKDEDFSVITMDGLMNDAVYECETYKVTDRVGYEKYAVIKTPLTVSLLDWELCVLVENTGTALNSEGEQVEFVEGYRGAQQVTLYAKEGVPIAAAGVKNGTLMQIAQNGKGEIARINILCQADTPLSDFNSDTQFYQAFGIIKGYINDIVDGVMKIGWSDPARVNQVMDADSAPVLIYDSQQRRKNITTGSVNDLKTYYSDGAEGCSIIVAQARYGIPNMIVVYR